MFFVRRFVVGNHVQAYKLLSLTPQSVVSDRYAHNLSHREYNPNERVAFEVSKDPHEWSFVERLIPKKVVPEITEKPSYPSGWTPQKSEAANSPYFIRRSRNHMVPVYLKIGQRGIRKLTYIKHVLGDIWLFAEELEKYLVQKTGKSVGVRVDEVGCKITLRGDYHSLSQQFILDKGL